MGSAGRWPAVFGGPPNTSGDTDWKNQTVFLATQPDGRRRAGDDRTRAACSPRSTASLRLRTILFICALPFCLWAAEFADVSPAANWDNLPPATADANDWPWWRGPTLNNVAAANQQPPLRWSETKNVRWRVALPGRGHATPCVRGQQIFLPGGDAKAVWLLCLDRETGNKLWQTEIYRGEFAKVHPDNSPVSATAACDGERVYVAYQSKGAVNVAALSLDGKIVWNKIAAAYESIQGYSASPALYKSAVIVPTDGSTGNKLTALHRQTGEVVWRSTMKQVVESYASPLVARVAGRDQLFLIGGQNTRSYDPNTGKLLWECDGPADFCAATVAFNDDTVFSTAGYPQKGLLAIRADGSSDVSQTHLRWKSDKKAGYVPSPIYCGGLLYAVSDTGLMRCHNPANGKVIWEHELKAPFYSSPVIVGDRVYLFDRKGKGYVFKTGREAALLATNTLTDGVFATPVILGGRLYVRTHRDLFCLEEKR
jgi:outer membrane protein assembly factor BamB